MQADLKIAIEYHQRGSLERAAQIYRSILALQPENADALHLLGVVAHQLGQHTQAVDLIGRAIALNPNVSAYYANLGEACRALGQFDRAVSFGHTALRLNPNNADAANNLGLALLAQGQTEAAIAQFRTALDLRPTFAMASNNMGNALRLQGDSAAALEHFRKAVAIDPQLAEGHSNLGQFLLEKNHLHEALVHCQEAVRLRPQFAEAHSNLGNVLRELGRLDQAKQCYTEALRLNPGLAMLYNNMGQAMQEEGKPDEALAWYSRGLELDPKLARLHCNLASLQAEQDRYDEAIRRYEIALNLDPNYPAAHTGLGWVWHEQGRYEDAQERYRLALRHRPDFAPALCNLGQVREELGDFADGERYFREALRHDARLAGAWSQLATQLRGQLPDEDLANMRQLLNDPDLTPGKRGCLHFGLAQVLDARKQFNLAGEHLVQANAIAIAEWRKRGQGYDQAVHSRFVDQMIAAFTPAFFERVRGFGVLSERPIFIVGMPRSGTTLTEQILANHSQVHGAGELTFGREDFVRLAGASGLDNQAFENLSRLDASTSQALANAHLERLRGLNDAAARVADKMPDNYLYLGLLATLFPRAKFVHCRRDLRDVAVSCWMTNFRSIRWASDPDHIVSRCQKYQRIVAHWQRVLPVKVLDVEYEDTVADLEGVARRLVSWCGLDWEPACLAFHEGKRPVRTASVTQVRQPIYSRSVARWKHYEKSLGPLFAKLPAL
ncbi:MAG TPA: tetratricopeptide repeat protein [Gemmataceae bacterium]|nr:tetratricopeptide repeat protein [Gemmataceae bacterium]